MNKLIDIADVSIGILKNRYESKTFDKKQFVYNMVDYRSISNETSITSTKFVSNLEIDQSFFTKENDILIKLFPPMSITKIEKDNENLLVSSNVVIVRAKKIDSNLLYFLLKIKFRYFNRLMDGSIVRSLNVKSIKDVTFEENFNDKNLMKKSILNELFTKKIVLENRKIQLIKKQQIFYTLKGVK